MTVQGKGKRRRDKNLRKAEAERYGFRLPPAPLKKKGDKGKKSENDMPRSLRKLIPYLNPDKEEPSRKIRNKYAYKHKTEEEKEEEAAAADEGNDAGNEGAEAGAGSDGEGGKAEGPEGDETAGSSRSEKEREKAINKAIRKATGGKLFPAAEEQRALDAAHSQRKQNKKNYLNMKKLEKKIRRKGVDPKADIDNDEYEAEKFGHLTDTVGFGEVAVMPPRITIKRRGGGGGAAEVGDVGDAGDRGRHGRLFQEIMQRASSKADRAADRAAKMAARKPKPPPSLHNEAVRNDVIEAYRNMRGTSRPKLPSAPKAALEDAEAGQAKKKKRKQK